MCSQPMFELLKATKLFQSESNEFVKEIGTIAEKNGFGNEAGCAKQVFRNSEFCDWDFNHPEIDVTLKSPLHKRAVRTLLVFANETKTFRNVRPAEDGEVNDEAEGLKDMQDMFRKCMKTSQTKEIHIETSRQLTQHCGNWGNAAHFILPKSEGTNLLAKELAKVKAVCGHKPFVRIPLNKFTPEWSKDMPHENFLLQPSILMPTLVRWAMAAQANEMIPMHVAMTHADICMRVAEEAAQKGKGTLVAAMYDELKQKMLAEMCLKGVSDWDPERELCLFDREIFERAVQKVEHMGQTKQSDSFGHSGKGKGSYSGKGSYNKPYNSSYDRNPSKGSHGQSAHKNNSWNGKRQWSGDDDRFIKKAKNY